MIGGLQPVIIDPNHLSVHRSANVSASSSQTFGNIPPGGISLVITVSSSSGTAPTLTYTLQEMDMSAALIGPLITGVALTTGTGTTPQIINLPNTLTGYIKVSWTIGGSASPTFFGVYATIIPNNYTPRVYGCYLAAAAVTNGAASLQSLLGITNPAASGKTVFIRNVEIFGINAVASTLNFAYRINMLSSLSAGTVLAAEKSRSQMPAAVAVVRAVGPTFGTKGADLWSGIESMAITASGALTPIKLTAFEDLYEEDTPITLLQGESLGVSVETNTTNWRHYVNISWSEGYD